MVMKSALGEMAQTIRMIRETLPLQTPRPSAGAMVCLLSLLNYRARTHYTSPESESDHGREDGIEITTGGFYTDDQNW